MKIKYRVIILLIFNIILSVGAISIGIEMIIPSGNYINYPQEWLTLVPFTSWFIPGIIAITLYGFGNVLAAITCFYRKWQLSFIMGLILTLSIVLQVIILKETYLVSAQLFIFGIIQIMLSLSTNKYLKTQAHIEGVIK